MGGQDKGLLTFNGKPMIEHTVEELSGTFDDILISANRNIGTYEALGCRVIQDIIPDSGPLGGIQAAFNATDKPLLLITTCDTPLINIEISRRLINSQQHTKADIHVAHDGQHMQMLHALLDLSNHDLMESLENHIQDDRSVRGWYRKLKVTEVDCSDLAKHFSNINTPEDLRQISKSP